MSAVREVLGILLDALVGMRCPVCRTRTRDWHLCDDLNHPGETAA